MRVFSPSFSPTLSDMAFTSDVLSEFYSLIFLLSSFLSLALEVLLEFTLIVVSPALPLFSFGFELIVAIPFFFLVSLSSTLSVTEKFKNWIFDIPIVLQTLNINN